MTVDVDPQGWITFREALSELRQPDAYARPRLMKAGARQFDGIWHASRSAVEALKAEFSNEDPGAHLSPTALRTLRIVDRARTVDEANGRVTQQLIDQFPQEVRRQTLHAALRDLALVGFVDVETDRKVIRRVSITHDGYLWAKRHQDELAEWAVASDLVAAAEPDQPVDVASLALFEPPLAASPPPPPVVAPNGHDAIDPGAIASALLKQVVRTLNDTELATLVAERDALRAHNESLAARLRDVTRERDRAEADVKDLRGVVHEIEMALTPVLVGNEVDWRDASLRADIIRLVGEAATWSSHYIPNAEEGNG